MATIRLDLAVCILVMQRPGVTHNALYPLDATFEIIKLPFIGKNQGAFELGSIHTTSIQKQNPLYNYSLQHLQVAANIATNNLQLAQLSAKLDASLVHKIIRNRNTLQTTCPHSYLAAGLDRCQPMMLTKPCTHHANAGFRFTFTAHNLFLRTLFLPESVVSHPNKPDQSLLSSSQNGRFQVRVGN